MKTKFTSPACPSCFQYFNSISFASASSFVEASRRSAPACLKLLVQPNSIASNLLAMAFNLIAVLLETRTVGEVREHLELFGRIKGISRQAFALHLHALFGDSSAACI